jgi:hypothetical protein
MSSERAKAIIDYAQNDSGSELRDALYSSIQDRVMAHIEAKKQEIAQGMLNQQEEQPEVEVETSENS